MGHWARKTIRASAKDVGIIGSGLDGGMGNRAMRNLPIFSVLACRSTDVGVSHNATYAGQLHDNAI